MIVYKIVNKTNGKIYVGQTKRNIRVRFIEHKKSSKTDRKQYSPLLQEIWEQGIENFYIEAIVENIESKKVLDVIEKFWIAKLETYLPEKGYNVFLGVGDIPERTRKKMTDKLKGNTRRRGKKASQETLEKMRIASTGKKKSEEEKKATAERVKGEGNPRSKVTNEQVLEIKTLLDSGLRICQVSKQLNISYSIVKKIKYGIRWKHI